MPSAIEQLVSLGFNSVSIPLSKNLWANVDIFDAPTLLQYRWFATRNSRSRTHYAARRTKRRTILMHSEIMCASLIDHRDRDGLNNRRCNLRQASALGNAQNRPMRSTNTSGFKGVSFHKPLGKWRAKIAIPGGKDKHLGYFSTPAAAATAYDSAAVELHGEFAVTNLSLGKFGGGA